MRKKPKISIIVPVYNVEKYLERCLDSILSQSFNAFELILVNDGSTDNSYKICEKYSYNDKRIKLINKENGGLSSARNAGIEASQGEYIGFIDSDDYIDKFMYEILYNYAEKNKSDIVICKYKKVDANFGMNENLNYNVEEINYSNFQALNQLYEENNIEFVVMWNKLYKRSLFDNIKFPD